MQILSEAAHLEVPTTATIEAVERQWAYLGYDRQPPNFVIDLSGCRFIEVATLLYLLGRLRGRAQHHLPTTFRLPRALDISTHDTDADQDADRDAARSVRNILRTWKFPEAVRDVTGTAFRELVDKADHEFFGENKGSMSAIGNTLPADFYPIRSYVRGQVPFDKRLAKREADRWVTDSYVLRVLNRRLAITGVGRRVSTHIINEGVMNAIRHPRAELLLTACRWDKAGRHLTVVIYDDGESVLDTLAKAVRDGYEVRAETLPSLEHHYLIERSELAPASRNEQPLKPLRLTSSYALTPESDEYEVLAAAFMPGITRDPYRKSDDIDTHPDAVNEDAANARPGMGLAVLLNSALDVFGGQVALRTNYFFLNARKGRQPDGADYRFRILKYPPISGLFHGNLMTIRLPLGENA